MSSTVPKSFSPWSVLLAALTVVLVSTSSSSQLLLPRNQQTREKLLSGQAVLLTGSDADRTIPADWIVEAVKNGARIYVENAIIQGPLDLKYAEFKEEFWLVACQIQHSADFSYSIFMRNLVLNQSTFHQGADFDSASLQYNAFLGGTRFLAGQARFRDLRVHGFFYAERASFGPKVLASFNRAEFKKSAFFNDAAFEGGADFISAQIESDAMFDNARFSSSEKSNTFDAAIFKGGVFFRRATFVGVTSFISAQIGDAYFDGVQFNGVESPVSFVGADIKGTAFFSGASFAGPANFARAQVDGDAYFDGARFNKPASLSSAVIKGTAFFGRVYFAGSADFVGAHFGGTAAVFRGAVFKQKADFNSAKIDGNALFNALPEQGIAAARFEGEAHFTAAQIGNAEFEGVEFKQLTSFNGTRIVGHAFFRSDPKRKIPPVSFEGEANFTSAQFGDTAEFHEAQFKHTPESVSFNRADIKGKTFFDGARFAGTASFIGANIGGEAVFQGATFDSAARFDASSFLGLAQFSAADGLPGTKFNRVSFDHARFLGDARFDEALFKGPASFRETSFRVIYFSPTGQAQEGEQFRETVDLRGCTYDRIQIHWSSLHTKLEPYDRQPYTQLERVVRSAGQDSEADEVYLERRAAERKRKFDEDFLAWVWDWLYMLLANYGVRPYRLAGIALLLIALGTIVFSRPGATLPIQPKVSSNPSERCSWRDAFRLSLRLFIPVKVPLATGWEPSDKSFGPVKFSDLATALTLAGWILVPLGIAALTGLLRRVAP